MTFICTRLSSLHRILTILSCLRSEAVWHGLVKLLDSFIFLTWREFLRSLESLIAWSCRLSWPTGCSVLRQNLPIMHNRHFLILNIFENTKICGLFSNLLFTIYCLQSFLPTLSNINVILFRCLNERQINLLGWMTLLVMLPQSYSWRLSNSLILWISSFFLTWNPVWWSTRTSLVL